MDAEISVVSLSQLASTSLPPPAIIDVRRAAAFARDPWIIAGAVRRLPELEAWQATLETWRTIVVYCVHGGEVSRDIAAALAHRGLDARYLAGGIEAWRNEGHPLVPFSPPTRWVTRERPKIDRIACPWLIRRFIDPSAEFFYVPANEVLQFAATNAATPYDVPDVDYSHDGPACSFDAFIKRHRIRAAGPSQGANCSPSGGSAAAELANEAASVGDPAFEHAALDMLATIVRGADTAALDLAPQAAGLLAISLGLSQMFADDHAMLRYGMLVYDALYAWCRQVTQGNWTPR
jgi:rhodanese-related sulfurtransferase